VTSQPFKTASKSIAMLSLPPETAQLIFEPGGGKLHRVKSSAANSFDLSFSTRASISPSRLLLRLSLATVWVLKSRNRFQITSHQTNYSTDAGDQQTCTQPPMPNNCCNHRRNASDNLIAKPISGLVL
jgi:hypothetical protein